MRRSPESPHPEAPTGPRRARTQPGHPGRPYPGRGRGVPLPGPPGPGQVRVRRLRDEDGPRQGAEELRDDRVRLSGGADVNPPRFDDAIRAAAEALAVIPGVRSAVPFGPAARGRATGGGDLAPLTDSDRAQDEPTRDS